ncbi:MAG: carboxymuconolactone decarboxylase family protein, partial [Anaerolineae bacterium]|nr:carboxymuconolactone decarboxylase family protein [Anaerolineae bacterium]
MIIVLANSKPGLIDSCCCLLFCDGISSGSVFYWYVSLTESKMKTRFQKRIYTFGTLLTDVGFLAANLPRAVAMSRNEKISQIFIEKIMTVVTAVNGCVYCSWFHAKQAVEGGLTEAEVQNLFNLQFETDASEFELPALLYAQHYAETNCHPLPDMNDKLTA